MPPGKDTSSSADAPLLKKKVKPRLRSEVLEIITEKQPNMDRHGGGGPPRDSIRHSPPPPRPPVKRKSSDREQSAGDAASKAERKQKGSVFSRISFPAEPGEPERGTGKLKKTSSEPPNGLKDHHERERERPAVNGYPGSSVGRRNGGGYDYESSDEERHFKRRPSSSRRESEEEEAVRVPRVLRERDQRVNEVKRR